MLPFFTEKFGNAASVNHAYGSEAAEAVESARCQVADLLNVAPQCLVFTSGATEANNLALKGIVGKAARNCHVVSTAAEHRSVLDPLRRLARSGMELTLLPVDSYGLIDPAHVAAALRENTVLVSVILANNEVGSINPIREIGAVCRERGVLFHTDAVQALAKIPLNLDDWPVDLVSVSAHKLYGPKGVGALYVRRGEPRIAIEPLFHGGGHERRLRSGTLPVPLIVGFGEACRLAAREMADESVRLAALRDRLYRGLQEHIGDIELNGHPTRRLSGNLNVSFKGVDGDALMTSLKGLAVSSGSACTSADPEPSHVLRAMGRSDALARSSLRFGLGRTTTVAEIDMTIRIVASAMRHLRGLQSETISTPRT